jgi:hypothetical protein
LMQKMRSQVLYPTALKIPYGIRSSVLVNDDQYVF